ncbi:MAG: hypothetical protein RR370_02625 [Synergistaceae bacterium]
MKVTKVIMNTQTEVRLFEKAFLKNKGKLIEKKVRFQVERRTRKFYQIGDSCYFVGRFDIIVTRDRPVRDFEVMWSSKKLNQIIVYSVSGDFEFEIINVMEWLERGAEWKGESYEKN